VATSKTTKTKASGKTSSKASSKSSTPSAKSSTRSTARSTSKSGTSSAKSRVSQSKSAMERFKTEVASELGVNLKAGGDLTARQAGKIGGEMVRRMIKEQSQKMK